MAGILDLEKEIEEKGKTEKMIEDKKRGEDRLMETGGLLAHKAWMKEVEKAAKGSHTDTKYVNGWAKKEFITHDRYVYKRVI